MRRKQVDEIDRETREFETLLKMQEACQAEKIKRKNGRISWKSRALKAEQEANIYFWLGLLLTVIAFVLGINVGLYAF